MMCGYGTVHGGSVFLKGVGDDRSDLVGPGLCNDSSLVLNSDTLVSQGFDFQPVSSFTDAFQVKDQQFVFGQIVLKFVEFARGSTQTPM